MFGSDDSRLHEEDFIFVPEFRSYLEGYRKTSGTRLTRKTINRHQDNVPLSGVILNFCMDTTCTTL